MNAEDQIRNLKETKPLTKEEKSKKLRTSIVLTMSTLISILFLVYAFMQKQEADYQKETSIRAMLEAQYQRSAAEEQRRLAQAAQVEAERQRALAVQALEDCKNGK